MRATRWIAAILVVGLGTAAVSPVGVARAAGPRRSWVAAWSTAHQRADAATVAVTDVTGRSLRLLARSTAEGGTVRVRLSNTDGGGPVTFGRVTIGVHDGGRSIRAGTLREARWSGRESVTVLPGRLITSDPIPLTVAAGTDLAVSLFVLKTVGAYSGHTTAKRVSWLSAHGSNDTTRDEAGSSFAWPMTSTYWLQGIDVLTHARPVVVAIGDSITDGHFAAPELDQDWPSVLAGRLGGAAAVLNAGIGGNQVTRTGCRGCGPPIVDRFGRDVLDVPGVTHAIVFAGINDIPAGVSARRIADGLADVARRARQRGLRVIGATLLPRQDTMLGWNPVVHERVRQDLNAWIRTTTVFDATVDFDAALRDPAQPDQLDYRFDSGDRLHPNALGMSVLGHTVDLRTITR